MRALLTAIALAVAALNPPGALPTAEDGYFQVVRPVAPGVWLLWQPRFQVQPVGNVTVIEQSDGLVLVDAGGSPGAGRRIVQMVKGLSAKPVKAVIITQWHGDKPQGLSEILKSWPRARTIATTATKAHLADPRTMNTPAVPDAAANAAFQAQVKGYLGFMADQGVRAATERERQGWAAGERLMNQYGLDIDGALTLPVEEGFDDRLLIDDPVRPVEARFLGRANTDGDAVVWLPKDRVLIVGEIVILPFPYGFESYPADWIATLEKVRAYDFKVMIPGHGPPQADRAQLDRISGALEEVRAQVGPLAARGLSLDEVRRRVDLSSQVTLFAGDDPWVGRWLKAFWIDPIVTSAYKEARGEPIVQTLKP